MRTTSALLTLLLPSLVVAAPAVPLPREVGWMIFAPSGEAFAKEAGALLNAAAKFSPAVASRRLNADLARSGGIGVLDLDTLRSAGIDPADPWASFPSGAARYTVFGLRSGAAARTAATTTLEAWAASRLLKNRDEKKDGGATIVTFSRSPGTKPVAGYHVAKDRLVICSSGACEPGAMAQTAKAYEAAAPVRPGVDGALLVYVAGNDAVKDLWFGAHATAAGLDLTGVVRKLETDLLDPKAAGGPAFVRALTASPDGGGSSDLPLRTRFLASPKAAEGLAAMLQRLVRGDESTATFFGVLGEAMRGPVEYSVAQLDVKNITDWRSPASLARGAAIQIRSPSSETGPLLAESRKLPGWAERAEKGTGGTAALGGSTYALEASQPGFRATISGRHDRNLDVATPAGAPALACAKGVPVASLRFDGASIVRSLDGVGLLAAMGSEVLMGAYAIKSEFGDLLSHTSPLTGLGCLEPSGRATMSLRWRLVGDRPQR